MPETSLGIPTPPDSVKISGLAQAARVGFEKVDEILTGGLTPELIEAATNTAVTAVQDAAEQLDFITGKDDRVLRTTYDLEYAIPFADEEGVVAGGFYDDGSFNTETPPRVQGAQGMGAQPINAPGWAYVEADEDGYVAFGIRDTGEVHISSADIDPLGLANAAIGYTRSQRNRVACFGDSLTNGYFGGTSGHTADAYPAKLQELVPAGVQVFNVSTSGWCVDEVAVRIGAIPVPLTAALNTIPASGGVSVSTTAVIGFRPLNETVNIPGTLAGIPGTLKRDTSNTVFTFTRTTTGTAVPLPPGTLFEPDQLGHDADTSVILLGRNDVAKSVKGSEATVAEHIAAGVQRIVDWHTRQLKQVLVLSPTTNTFEERGSTGHTTATTAGALLAQAHGPKYYDLRRYLVDQAIYDLGITPTATDLAKMAADTLPPSIMDPGAAGTGDGTHYSKATAQLVAARINDYFTPREWIQK